MSNLLNEGQLKREDYAGYFIKNTNGQKRPSALSIFPHVGMISNVNTFTTKKMIYDKEVVEKPAHELDERIRKYHLV
jgi:hypothetical protein